MEKIALGHGLEPNTALGFASCCISLSPSPRAVLVSRPRPRAIFSHIALAAVL